MIKKYLNVCVSNDSLWNYHISASWSILTRVCLCGLEFKTGNEHWSTGSSENHMRQSASLPAEQNI